jgi:hypothetical protein
MCSSRGQLYRTKVSDADGPVLCARTITPTLDSCRAMLASGVTGPFEAWHESDSFPRLTGEIANVAKLEVKEGPVRFVGYEPSPITRTQPQARPESPRSCTAFVASRRFVNSRRRCRRTGNCDFVRWGRWIRYDKFATGC